MEVNLEKAPVYMDFVCPCLLKVSKVLENKKLDNVIFWKRVYFNVKRSELTKE